jgi:hypothetical protein
MNRMRLNMKSKNFLGLGVLAVAMAAAPLATLHAEEAAVAPRDDGVRQADGANAQGGGPDGLARAGSPVVIRTVNYLGSAPYICTPSGFGERSKCFLRSSVRVNRR